MREARNLGGALPLIDTSYGAIWERFTQIGHTQDSLAAEQRGWRRWAQLPYVAFVIPVEEPAVLQRLATWQTALRPWLAYAPQPAHFMHITLHIAGRLCHPLWFWRPDVWRRSALERLARTVQPVIESFSPFDVLVGPPNAFPNVLFAEVHDRDSCLRALRARLLRALPLRARTLSPWAFVPHITLGYWGRQPAAPVIAALAAHRQDEPVPLHVRRIRFTIYARDLGEPASDTLVAAREDVLAEYHLAGYPAP